ncbi:hypothetical protein FLAG1_06837 [Fusarium langsethiae]|uniref:F-box domain-containing protein n=1 Tax=Fusarium langsethiae TaxID=179993 RepID=A0A0M9EV60_FUSLA|nr:hypothetical protein FLAG1_06837 [Fusarium langsethiae]GKU21332.1 unnamed protein product [Fusarium langsethiae]
MTIISDNIFASLPVELTIEVLSYLSPGELLSVVNASPCLGRDFLGSRDRILLPHVQNFYLRFGQIDAIPLIKFLSELRSIRERYTTIANTEKHVEPVFDAMRTFKQSETTKWRLGLSTLAKADILIPEMRELFVYHREIEGETPLESRNQWLAFDQLPSRLIWLFARTYMVFECNCSMFHHPDGLMLKYRGTRGRGIFLGDEFLGDDLSEYPECDRSVFEKFCPLECLIDKHYDVLDEVILRLGGGQIPVEGQVTLMHQRVPPFSYALAYQGYRYYLYVEGLVKNNGDLESHMLDVVRITGSTLCG